VFFWDYERSGGDIGVIHMPIGWTITTIETAVFVAAGPGLAGAWRRSLVDGSIGDPSLAEAFFLCTGADRPGRPVASDALLAHPQSLYTPGTRVRSVATFSFQAG
jgi:hypothetical protein